MLLINYTHKNGVVALAPVTIAIDPEKIVSVFEIGGKAVIEYAETFDRRREPVFYRLDVGAGEVVENIQGDYEGKEGLLVNIIGSNDEDYAVGVPYEALIQEKYIVDISEAKVFINGTKVACRMIEFVPASFVPVILYVSESLASMVTNPPPTPTTTSTTTTTTEIKGYCYRIEIPNADTSIEDDDLYIGYTPPDSEFTNVVYDSLTDLEDKEDYYCVAICSTTQPVFSYGAEGQPVEPESIEVTGGDVLCDEDEDCQPETGFCYMITIPNAQLTSGEDKLYISYSPPNLPPAKVAYDTLSPGAGEGVSYVTVCSTTEPKFSYGELGETVTIGEITVSGGTEPCSGGCPS